MGISAPTPPHDAAEATFPAAESNGDTPSTGPTGPAMATWASSIEWVDPRCLADHPVWLECLSSDSAADEGALVDFVRDPAGGRVIIATGQGCSSSPNVILDGHRWCHTAVSAGIKAVPVLRRTSLTADDEEVFIIRAALGNQYARKLSPSRLAALEARLFRAYGRIRGYRSDLATSVGPSGGHPRPDTLALVANETGQPRNAVANRRKVFGSVASPLALGAAVDQREISLTRAADEVRAAEAVPEVKAVLKTAETEDWPNAQLAKHPVIERAQASIAERVESLRTGARSERAAERVELVGVQDGDVIRAEGRFARRRVRVEVVGRRVTITQVRETTRADEGCDIDLGSTRTDQTYANEPAKEGNEGGNGAVATTPPGTMQNLEQNSDTESVF